MEKQREGQALKASNHLILSEKVRLAQKYLICHLKPVDIAVHTFKCCSDHLLSLSVQAGLQTIGQKRVYAAQRL
jgi:hypothetical protein